MLLPEELTLIHVDGEDVIGDAGYDGDLSRAARRRDFLDDQRRNSACIWRTSLSNLIFQSSLVSRTFDGREDLLVLCHASRLTLAPSVSQSALQRERKSASPRQSSIASHH